VLGQVLRSVYWLGYWLDCLSSKSRHGHNIFFFSRTSRPALGPNQLPVRLHGADRDSSVYFYLYLCGLCESYKTLSISPNSITWLVCINIYCVYCAVQTEYLNTFRYHRTVRWLRQLVACLWLWGHGFYARSICVGFAVRKVALVEEAVSKPA